MTRTAPLLLVAALAAPLPATAQETLPPGTLIAEALAADLPEAGLDFVVSQFSGLIPPDLVIGSIPTQEIADIWVCSQDFWIDNLVVHTEVNSITSDGQSPATYPPDGALVVNVNLTLSINDPVDTATVYLDGCLDYVCNLHTTPADINVSLPVTLKISQDSSSPATAPTPRWGVLTPV